ncbi:hypothetical protein WT09_05730 [Burkholderia stagnalis]|nr:hypothetical protein WT09_05730 [Burkholderia stagnalis]
MKFTIQLNRIHAIDRAPVALRVVSNDSLTVILSEDALEVVREQKEKQHVTKLPGFPIWYLTQPFVELPTVLHQRALVISAQLTEESEKGNEEDKLTPLVLIEARAGAAYAGKNIVVQPARVRW